MFRLLEPERSLRLIAFGSNVELMQFAGERDVVTFVVALSTVWRILQFESTVIFLAAASLAPAMAPESSAAASLILL